MDSDQKTLQKDTGSASVMRAARTRVTSIQAKGIAGSVLTLHDAATTGAAAGSSKSTCRQCGGSGSVQSKQGFFTLERTCSVCAGKGTMIENPCTSCAGSGRVRKKRKLKS